MIWRPFFYHFICHVFTHTATWLYWALESGDHAPPPTPTSPCWPTSRKSRWDWGFMCILIHLIIYLFLTFPTFTLIQLIHHPSIHHHIHHISNILPFKKFNLLMDSSNHNQHSPSQPDINRTSSALGSSTFIGKHRLAAIISQQNQQIQIIQVTNQI